MSDAPFEHPSVTVSTVARMPLGKSAEAATDAFGDSTRFARDVPVRVDSEGIFVEGKLACPRASIESVFLRFEQRLVVFVNMKSGLAMTFKLSDADDARRMLESLEAPFSRVRTLLAIAPQLDLADFRSARAALPLLGGFAAFATLVGLALHFFGAAALALPAAAGALISLVWSTARVEIGVDGVRVQWFSLSRYYAFSEIESVTHDDGDALVLGLRSGRRVTLQMSAPEHIADAVKRIEEGIAALKATPKATEAPALRERVTDAVRVAELRRLGAVREGDYRVAGLDREQLWAVVEDPANEAVVRANAAAALSGRLDEGERQRLRVAASVTASPKVRVALETAAEAASDEELAEALSQVDAER